MFPDLGISVFVPFEKIKKKFLFIVNTVNFIPTDSSIVTNVKYFSN